MAEAKKTIVLVDDEEHLLELVRTTLEAPEYRLLVATDGTEALRLVDTEKVDLLILDWMMPGISGIGVLEELKSRPNPPATIMLTAKSGAGNLEFARASGAGHYLVKPFSPLELIERVEEVLLGRTRRVD